MVANGKNTLKTCIKIIPVHKSLLTGSNMLGAINHSFKKTMMRLVMHSDKDIVKEKISNAKF